MTGNRPNLFIVGAPKAGTTSLYHYLKQHPDIFMSNIKEPNFFNTDLHRKNRLSKDEYSNLFKSKLNVKYYGESTPLYLVSKDAAKKIKEYSPNAKIIIMLRRPVDLMYSAYFQNKYNGIENSNSFQEALSLEEQRKKEGTKTVNGEPINRLFYSDLIKFNEQVERFFKYFDRKDVHIILYDHLKRDTKKEFNKVLEFLKLRQYSVDFNVMNQQKKLRNIKIQKNINNPPNFLSKTLRMLVPFKIVRSRIYSKLLSLNSVNINKENLDLEFAKKIVKSQKKEIGVLSRLIGEDLSSWNKINK